MRTDLVKRIDRRKAIAYFRSEDGWSDEETDEQVLTPLKTRSLMGTAESDPLSIMCYQIPAEITKDGKAITGGIDINSTDHAFASKVYPKNAPIRASVAQLPIPAPAPMPPGAAPRTMAGPVADETLQIVVLDGFDASTAGYDMRFQEAAKPVRR